MKKIKLNKINRKLQKIRIKANSYDYKRILLLYGLYGLKALESTRLKAIQIESIKKTIKKVIKKSGLLWILVKPNKSITQKPAQVRMGKGKGSHSYFIAIIKKGTILCELGGTNLIKKIALKALHLAAQKLPIKTKICIYKA
jgi:large subunit ribosomal protein L16